MQNGDGGPQYSRINKFRKNRSNSFTAFLLNSRGISPPTSPGESEMPVAAIVESANEEESDDEFNRGVEYENDSYFNRKLREFPWIFVSMIVLVCILLTGSCLELFSKDDLNIEKHSSTWNLRFGWFYALCACILWGSYGTILKAVAITPEISIIVARVHPIILHAWTCLSTSVCGLIFSVCVMHRAQSFGITTYGLLSGLIWQLSGIFAFLSVKNIDFWYGPLIWSTVTTLISIIFGKLIAGEKFSNHALFGVSIFFLLLGNMLTITCELPLLACRHKKDSIENEEAGLGSSIDFSQDAPFLQPVFNLNSTLFIKISKSKLFCFVSAVLMGLCNGSFFVPFRIFNDKSNVFIPVSYIFSFSISLFVSSATILIICMLCGPLDLRNKHRCFNILAILTGSFSGSCWFSGFVCAIFGIMHFGISVAMPLYQLSVVINGIWAAFFFRDLSGISAIKKFILGAIIMVLGAYGASSSI